MFSGQWGGGGNVLLYIISLDYYYACIYDHSLWINMLIIFSIKSKILRNHNYPEPKVSPFT